MAGRLTTSLICVAVAAGAALTLSACGGSGDSTNASKSDVTDTAPALPRVDGKWKWTGKKLEPKEGTWKFKPDCASGACNVQETASGNELKYVLDQSTGVYTAKTVANEKCVDANGKTTAKNAYKDLRRWVATPTKAVAGPDGPVATALNVRVLVKYKITKAGRAAGCASSVKAVRFLLKGKRTDAPTGDPVPVK